jgi:hypothetical protein
MPFCSESVGLHLRRRSELHDLAREQIEQLEEPMNT